MQDFSHDAFPPNELGLPFSGLHAFPDIVVEGVKDALHSVSPKSSHKRNESLCVERGVGRGHQIDKKATVRIAFPHHKEPEKPLPLGWMPCGQAGGFAPCPNLVKGGFHKCIEQSTVCVQILYGPPGASVFEAQPEVIHLFIGFQIVANFREAVFHLVPVVPGQW
jgi:hypothetical protein